MRYESPPDEEGVHSWFAPLVALARVVQSEPRYRFFDPADFMVMYRVVRPPRPSLYVYKHCYTRRAINLDDAGHAYRFIVTRRGSRSASRYLAHRDLRAALDHLELWELPWMKPGLEEHRHGLSAKGSWQLHPDVTVEELEAGGGDGDLHLV